MAANRTYGTGTRMLTLAELCEWLNITQDRASILKAMNQAVTRLYVQEDTDDGNAQAA